MTEAQLKGKIFECLLKHYLREQGYTVIPDKMQNYYGVSKRANGLNVKGRGGWHQIDALGQFQFQIPFVYPVRLLSEAKCHKKKIGLPIVRNFVGVLKDISENYFIDEYQDLQHKNRFRFTDCGTIFSVSDFSKDAQMYAFAQGIYLVQVSEFLPLIKNTIKKAHYGINRLPKNICDDIDHPHYETFCYMGVASGLYPIIITSKNEFPFEKFRESDEAQVEIYYTYDEESKEVYDFRIKFDKWTGIFQLPKYTWDYYMELPNFREAMLNMKEKILNYIDLPLKIENKRRIIRLKLDRSWLNVIKKRIK